MDLAPAGSGSGDDQPNRGRDQKHYHRHSAEQIQQLEEFFKDNPHPDENQRQQLSRELGLQSKQIKFWFQNKRTQTKAQNERADNNALRTQNERYVYENLAMREALHNLLCQKCEGPGSGDEAPQENLQKLRNENNYLRSQYQRLVSVFSSFCQTKNTTLESVLAPAGLNPFLPMNILHHQEQNFLGQGGFIGGAGGAAPTLFDLENAAAAAAKSTSSNPIPSSVFLEGQPNFIPGVGSSNNPNLSEACRFRGIQEMEKSIMVDAAIRAMDELVELLRVDEPLWIWSSADARYILHYETYDRRYPKICHVNGRHAWRESSKESRIVSMAAVELLDIFQDPKKWMEFFPTIVNKARTDQVLDTGDQGGSLYLMYEKLHVLSPFVAQREFLFYRYIRPFDNTTWIVLQASYDCFSEAEVAASGSSRAWMFPSGCMIQDIPDGKTKITWIEHVQVDDKFLTHPMYKDTVRDSYAYGANRWVVALESMSERLAFSMGSTTLPGHELERAIGSTEGTTAMAKLSHKMIKNFHSVLASMPENLDSRQFEQLNKEGFRVSIRPSDDLNQPDSMIVCVATSLRLPTSFENLFRLFKDNKAGAGWYLWSNGNPTQEIMHISTGNHPGNSISLSRPSTADQNDSNMMILQESCIHDLGGFLIYAPVEFKVITSLINGNQDGAEIAVLTSGFIISGDVSGGPSGASTCSSAGNKASGSLLTVAIQIMLSAGAASEQTSVESAVAAVHALMSSTIHKISNAI